MTIIVQKYGGSSVASVEQIEAVAEKVVAAKKDGNDVVVVVSAMGKTTDQLLALAKEITPTPPRRELDMLLSTGERVSMALMSMAIQKRGFDAISFTGSQSGIITNDRHFDAKIIDIRPHRIEDELHRGKIVIVAGYQGMSYKREITTLGRGGSDTTALALAAALGAAHAEIYSDVDGIYSADPRIVSDAKHIAALSFDDMLALSRAGAKVLHAAAVEFAKREKITIRARSTFKAGRETVVCDENASSGLVGVVARHGIAKITHDDLDALLESFDAAELEPLFLKSDGKEVSALIATSAMANWDERRRLLVGTNSGSFGAVEIVGSAKRPIDVQRRILRVLANASIAVHASYHLEQRLLHLVDDADVERATKLLHAELL